MGLLAQAEVALQPPSEAVSGSITIQSVVSFTINLLFFIGVFVAVAFLIFGGIKWVTSGGDKGKVEAARNHIVAAIVGLIIAVGAFFIINIVFALLTGHSFDFKNICIPSIDNPSCGGAGAGTAGQAGGGGSNLSCTPNSVAFQICNGDGFHIDTYTYDNSCVAKVTKSDICLGVKRCVGSPPSCQ